MNGYALRAYRREYTGCFIVFDSAFRINYSKQFKQPKMSNTCKTRLQLAEEYGISRRTLYRLLKRYKIDLPSGVLPPEAVLRVYQALGRPNRATDQNREGQS